jgi:hypothetical protein
VLGFSSSLRGLRFADEWPVTSTKAHFSLSRGVCLQLSKDALDSATGPDGTATPRKSSFPFVADGRQHAAPPMLTRRRGDLLEQFLDRLPCSHQWRICGYARKMAAEACAFNMQ